MTNFQKLARRILVNGASKRRMQSCFVPSDVISRYPDGKVPEFHKLSDYFIKKYGATHFDYAWHDVDKRQVCVNLYQAEAFGAAVDGKSIHIELVTI